MGYMSSFLGMVGAALISGTGTADAAFVPFSGPLGTTRPLFEAAAGPGLATATFDTLANGQEVSSLTGLQAHFAGEDASGASLPLPIVASNASPISPPRWMANFGNGRPAWSPWVIRPDAGEAIYSFGQANSQGDWVRIQAYDAANTLVGSVDAPALSPAFAGFVSTTPIDRVVVTPLGNSDGRNGMDDVQISVTPIPEPNAVALVTTAGLAIARRRRVLNTIGKVDSCPSVPA